MDVHNLCLCIVFVYLIKNLSYKYKLVSIRYYLISTLRTIDVCTIFFQLYKKRD